MKTLKRTNTKVYLKNIQTALLSRISFEDLGDVELTDKEKIEYLLGLFDREHGFENNVKRYPNKQDRLSNWLQGLPSYIDLPFTNWDVLKFAAELHEIDSIPKNKEDSIINNHWSHIAFHLLKLNQSLKK